VFLCYYALTFYGDEWYIGNIDVIIEFSQSAFKYGITDADIRWAFDNVLYDEQLDEDTLRVFHAMKCRNIVLSLIHK